MNFRKKILAKMFSGSIDDAQEMKNLFEELREVYLKIEDFAATLEDSPEWVRARAEFAGSYVEACHRLLDPALAKFPELDDRYG